MPVNIRSSQLNRRLAAFFSCRKGRIGLHLAAVLSVRQAVLQGAVISPRKPSFRFTTCLGSMRHASGKSASEEHSCTRSLPVVGRQQGLGMSQDRWLRAISTGAWTFRFRNRWRMIMNGRRSSAMRCADRIVLRSMAWHVIPMSAVKRLIFLPRPPACRISSFAG